MLSYMLPVEEKSPPRNLNLNLNLNGNISESDENTKLLHHEPASVLKNSSSREHNILVDLSDTSAGTTTTDGGMNGGTSGEGRKIKMTKCGVTKTVPLKRVSFGSSKGSMVETLVFETPTPLPEHAEREFGFPADTTTTQFAPGNRIYTNHLNNNSYLDDSGIEMQEELDRANKVRVSFFQSSKPQQVSPPENHIGFFNDFDSTFSSDLIAIADTNQLDENGKMTAIQTQPNYDRQISTESGWDNPFRPGGDLSREADEIVNLIKGGKPITPTGDAGHIIANGAAQKDTNHSVENGTTVVDGATKTEVSQVQSSQNGTKSSPQKLLASSEKKNGDAGLPAGNTAQTQISNQVVPGPQSASHVIIDDKKKKKCTCCVIQ